MVGCPAKSSCSDGYLFWSEVATCPQRHCPPACKTQNVMSLTAQEVQYTVSTDVKTSACLFYYKGVRVCSRVLNGPGETGPGCVSSGYAPMPSMIYLVVFGGRKHAHTHTNIHTYTYTHTHTHTRTHTHTHTHICIHTHTHAHTPSPGRHCDSLCSIRRKPIFRHRSM
jgi:hypothetical protein